MELKQITEKDFKHSLKKLLKSDSYSDLMMVLNGLAQQKVQDIINEPNMQNLAVHKIELELYKNNIATFETYHEDPARI